MRALFLEPYYGGSHKSFVDGWVSRSRHEWDVLTLPPNKWKWRMRQSAVEFSTEVKKRAAQGQPWDVVVCSDMLNLAEFLGLCGKELDGAGTVAYFHENQLTYPNRFESERDYQYVLTNMTTGLAADAVWFNSEFHREEFLCGLGDFLRRMPEPQSLNSTEKINSRSAIHSPGINVRGGDAGKKRIPGPFRILWAARWEHDKNPEDFFEALKRLRERQVDFRLSVVGEKFREYPEVFDWAKGFFSEQIDRWGYQSDRQEYAGALTEADVIVSTANHEFFGISIVEAVASGAYPVLPNRLSYPEIVKGIEKVCDDEFFYDGSVDGLVEKLERLAEKVRQEELWGGKSDRGIEAMKKFAWERRAKEMDIALEGVNA